MGHYLALKFRKRSVRGDVQVRKDEETIPHKVKTLAAALKQL